MAQQEAMPDWQPPSEAEIEEQRRQLPQPEGDSPALFDRLFNILLTMRADTHPVDITSSADWPEASRITLMALTGQDGTRRITEKWIRFIFAEDLEYPERGDEIPPGAHDITKTQLTVEDDKIVVRAHSMGQTRDPKTDLPIPGRFTGPSEPEVLPEYERLDSLLWLSSHVIGLARK